jgi:predicted SprT family Zn-dependent metalloprotease
MATLAKTIFELGRIFRALNETYYDGELTAPIITVQTQGKRNAYGWCSSHKIWRETSSGEGEKTTAHEINFCAEYLSRDDAAIVETMLHEMAHLYNAQKGIKDCSRAGTYHNEKYKATAETHGLNVTHVDKYGWALTELKPIPAAHVPALHIDRRAFRVVRQTAAPKSKSKSKSSSRKYICPMCGTIVRATKDVNIRCTDCDADFRLESEF